MSMNQRGHSTIAGMTLTEMMVSVMLISVTYSIGSISVRHYRTDMRCDISASRLYNTLREARARAIHAFKNVIVTFDKASQSYTSCEDQNLNEVCDPTESTIAYKLEDGIIFDITAASGFEGLTYHNNAPTDPILEGSRTIIFHRNGTTSLSFYNSVIYLAPQEDLSNTSIRLDRFKAVDIVSTTGLTTLWHFHNGSWQTR